MAGGYRCQLSVLVGCGDGCLLGVEMKAFMGTPGPWLAVGGEVMTEDFTVDGEIFVDHICNAEVINGVSHNANLIAAAPELLDACTRMRNQLYAAGYESKKGSLNPTEDLLHEIELAIDKKK